MDSRMMDDTESGFLPDIIYWVGIMPDTGT
jgi:hypothetical protein